MIEIAQDVEFGILRAHKSKIQPEHTLSRAFLTIVIGKHMIYEMRTYTIKIGKLNQYIAHFEKVGLPIIQKYGTLVGYWSTDIGELNQVIHIWAYDDLNTRAQKRQELYKDPDWLRDFIPEAMDMLEKQENKILSPAAFSPIQ